MASAPWHFSPNDLGQLYTQQQTYGGCLLSASQLVTVLQHAIRQNQPDVAQQAAARLLASTQGHLLWQQLVLISASDVGLANLEAVQLCVRGMTLHDKVCRVENGEKDIELDDGCETKLWRQAARNDARVRKMLALCVEVLCKSPKSREAMHACVLYMSEPRVRPEFHWPKNRLAGKGEERTLLAAFASGLGHKYDYKMLDKLFEPFFVLPLAKMLKQGLRLVNITGCAWKGKALLACAALMVSRPDTSYNLTVHIPLDKNRIEVELAQTLYAKLIHQPDSLPPLVAIPEPSSVDAASRLEDAESKLTPRFHAQPDTYYGAAVEYCKTKKQH
jgi:hypothetical protein